MRATTVLISPTINTLSLFLLRSETVGFQTFRITFSFLFLFPSLSPHHSFLPHFRLLSRLLLFRPAVLGRPAPVRTQNPTQTRPVQNLGAREQQGRVGTPTSSNLSSFSFLLFSFKWLFLIPSSLLSCMLKWMPVCVVCRVTDYLLFFFNILNMTQINWLFSLNKGG